MSARPVVILPPAKADIITSAAYLDNARPGYGEAFIRQIHATLGHIRDFPESCQHFRGDCRRSILHRFKHALVYRCLADRIEVVGVLHVSRDPNLWQPRTGG